MILESLLAVLNFQVIIYIAIGVIVGIIFGSIPGLTATMAIIMFLPVTYSMDATTGMSMLLALYIGGISGGLISAILLKIPGTPSSVATVFDGEPMAKNGEPAKALGIAVISSFVGTIIGIILLIFLTPLLCEIALKFQAYEYSALALFSLSIVVALTGKDMIKGLSAGILGGMLATIGLAPIDSQKRFTFGMFQLNNGISLVVILIGLFAITEILKYAETIRRKELDFEIKENVNMQGFKFSWKNFFAQARNMVVSGVIGTGIGLLPGIGGAIGCMVSYTVAKNTSKYPEKFGTGIPDGIVASETANNGVVGGAMIPLLSLGIPGDPATAVLLGGLMIHNIAPGPLIYEKNGLVVYSIFFAMLIAALFMMVFMLGGMKFFISILKIPKNYLYPIVLVLCVVGIIGNSNMVFDSYLMIPIGLLAYLMSKRHFPSVPLIIGFILGPMFEENIRRVSQLASSESILSHPIAIGFLFAAFVVIVVSVRLNIKENKANV